MFTACTSGRATSTESDFITVEGRVSARGNVPFTAVVLITDENNWYVLDLSDSQRSEMLTPSLQRVTGRLYLGKWNSYPFARIEVNSFTRIE